MMENTKSTKRPRKRARKEKKQRHIFADLLYKRSLFCKESGGLPLCELKKDGGAYGEYLTYDSLRREKGKWLFRLRLPHGEDFTEIDALFICSRGAFILESKNISGRIYGKPSQPDWVQTLKTEKGIRKKRFFNPLMQNAAHLHALREICGEDVPAFPMVVLSGDCEVWAPELKTRKKDLLNLRELRKTVRTFPKGALSGEEEAKLYALLQPFKTNDEQAMREHIASIAKKNTGRSRAGKF